MNRDNVTPIKPASNPDSDRVPVFYVTPPDNRGAFFTGLLWGLQAVTLILICVSIGAAL